MTRRQIREAERAAAESAQRPAAHLAPQPQSPDRPTHAAWDPRSLSAQPAGPSRVFSQGPDIAQGPDAQQATRAARRDEPARRSESARPSGPAARPTTVSSGPGSAGHHTPSWVPTERRSVAQPPVPHAPAVTATLTPPTGAPQAPRRATQASAPQVFTASATPTAAKSRVAPAVFVPSAQAAAASRGAATTAIPAVLDARSAVAPLAPVPAADETVVLDAFVALDEPATSVTREAVTPDVPAAPETPAAPEATPTPAAPSAVFPTSPVVVPEPARAGAPDRRAEAPRVVARSGSEKRPASSEHVVRTPARALNRAGRNAVRFGVVGALAAVTVAVPLGRGSLGSTDVLSGLPSDHGTLPTTVSALTAAPLSVSPPASLTTVDSAILDARGAELASRDASRQPIPGCDPSARAAGENGRLARVDLCTLWDGHTQMRADAASALAELNAVYVARFGADMCLASGYRTLQEQYSVKARRGGLAAAPGKSNHGWGLAVDFCSAMTSGARWTWLNQNAGTYGFENPEWAKPGGSGPFERWHWEYTKGVKADGEYYG
ncbi:M15 family metallopeptidase [Cellulomonas persica]|uniref:M15 family metallopeptidase n=1 Tax=Cellulomonas persica TaxID=76861 RepID=UPI0011BFDE93|nr:M15 family metallopeptidase [Cellulomonas persica]